MLILMLVQRKKLFQVEVRDAVFGTRTRLSLRYTNFAQANEAYQAVAAMTAKQRVNLMSISHHVYTQTPTKIHRESLFSS